MRWVLMFLLALVGCDSEPPAERGSDPTREIVDLRGTWDGHPGDAPTEAGWQPTTMPPDPAPATEVPSPTPLATEGDFFLQLVEPAEVEVNTSESTLTVVGRTRVDAVVTIDDSIVEPDVDGRFSLTVELEEGPNIIEVVASVASGEQEELVLVVIYLP